MQHKPYVQLLSKKLKRTNCNLWQELLNGNKVIHKQLLFFKAVSLVKFHGIINYGLPCQDFLYLLIFLKRKR